MIITYRIKPKRWDRRHNLVAQMLKDLSWGTHSEELTASNKTIGSSTFKNYTPSETLDDRYEPEIMLKVNFHKDHFCFEEEGINHFIGTVAGNVIRNHEIESIVVEDFELQFDEEALFFPGPKLGIERLKKEFFSKTLTSPRPLLAFSIKPRMGITPEEYGKMIWDAASAKIDIIEDDERLVSPAYCRFEDRISQIKKISEEEDISSRFSVNLTCNMFDLKERIDLAYEAGIRMFKLDVTVAGFDSLNYLRGLLNTKEEDCIITVFPDVHGPVYRCLSRGFILKLSRLCGADIIYAGSPFPTRMGRLVELIEDKGKWQESIEHWMNRLKNSHDVLKNPINKCKHIKSSLPTITHDVDPYYLEVLTYLIKMGYQGSMDYAYFIGGGIGQLKCNHTIKTSAELWLKILSYAGNYNLDSEKYDDLNKLTYYRTVDPNFADCLDEMGMKVKFSDGSIGYKKLV